MKDFSRSLFQAQVHHLISFELEFLIQFLSHQASCCLRNSVVNRIRLIRLPGIALMYDRLELVHRLLQSLSIPIRLFSILNNLSKQ